jgi:hypothetical protein
MSIAAPTLCYAGVILSPQAKNLVFRELTQWPAEFLRASR